MSNSANVWEVDFTDMDFDHYERAAVVYFVYDRMMKYYVGN